MMEMSMLGTMTLIPMLLYFVVPLCPLIYLVAKWKGYREKWVDDPQLGLKAILHYFRLICLQLGLLGAFVTIMGLILSEGRTARVGLALVVAGGGGFVLHLRWLARSTNNASVATMDRLYGACNWILCGLLALGGLVMFLVVLLEGEAAKTVFITLAFFFIYAVAWALQAAIFLRLPQVPRQDPPAPE